MRLSRLLSALFILAVMSGCAIGNDASLHHSRTVSIGQEFLDLQKARDHKVITQAEYLFIKRKLLEQLALIPAAS